MTARVASALIRARAARDGRVAHPAARAASARASGFTLIEVLVAVAIVAVSLAAGSRAASSVIDTSQRLSDVTLGQWCADNQLTELRLIDQLPPVGNTPFTCTELGREFNGTVKAQPTPNPSFRRVDVIISDGDSRQLLTVSTVMSQ